jgi:DNA sulfur modification protein DndB
MHSGGADGGGATHTFPTIRGEQAGRPFYLVVCPLRVVPTLFRFDEEDVPAEVRAQRTLNRARVPEIASYLTANRDSYVLSALSASIDCCVKFVPLGDSGMHGSVGLLRVPTNARIIINDGQHRRAAIESALQKRPELGDDNVPVLFFVDVGLKRSQQMFADLNKYAVRPSHSLSTLYDHRDSSSELARFLSENCAVFKGLTEFERSSISNRSTKLFTLSGIKHASRALLRKRGKDPISDVERLLSLDYWEAVGDAIPDWGKARARQVATSELRLKYVHAHGVGLQALGIAGAELLSKRPKDWKAAVRKLRSIDWSRDNALWASRALRHGRVSKATTSVRLTANAIKRKLGLQLTFEDEELEKTLP